MLKPWNYIDCPAQSIISDKVLNYLKDHTEFLTNQNLKLWNKINTAELVHAVPEIVTWCMSYNLKIKEIAITVWNKPVDVGLHVDELPAVAKINFPILNTKNSFNEWYTVPKELFEQVKPIRNQFGAEYYNLENIDLTQCTKIGRVELLRPVVFNSQIPHKIRMTADMQFPRIVMSIIFHHEPLYFL